MAEQAAAATAGLGVSMDIEETLSSDAVWAVLELKVKEPHRFLPVKDVLTRPSDDGAGTYREMTMSFSGARMVENIYTTGAPLYEVRFVVVNDENEHVNIITTDAATGRRKLEFYKRVAASKERVPWAAPAAVALGGIKAVLEMARSGLPASA